MFQTLQNQHHCARVLLESNNFVSLCSRKKKIWETKNWENAPCTLEQHPLCCKGKKKLQCREGESTLKEMKNPTLKTTPPTSTEEEGEKAQSIAEKKRWRRRKKIDNLKYSHRRFCLHNFFLFIVNRNHNKVFVSLKNQWDEAASQFVFFVAALKWLFDVVAGRPHHRTASCRVCVLSYDERQNMAQNEWRRKKLKKMNAVVVSGDG